MYLIIVNFRHELEAIVQRCVERLLSLEQLLLLLLLLVLYHGCGGCGDGCGVVQLLLVVLEQANALRDAVVVNGHRAVWGRAWCLVSWLGIISENRPLCALLVNISQNKLIRYPA